MGDLERELRGRITRSHIQRLRDAGATLQRLAGSRFGDAARSSAAREAEVVFEVASTLAELLFGEPGDGPPDDRE